jgi:hypothetical protein
MKGGGGRRYLEIIDSPSGCLGAGFRGKNDFEFTVFFCYKICTAILITKRVTANDDGLFPSGDETRDTRDDNGFTEDCPVENVSDSPVGGSPHLFQIEFYHYQYSPDKPGGGGKRGADL